MRQRLLFMRLGTSMYPSSCLEPHRCPGLQWSSFMRLNFKLSCNIKDLFKAEASGPKIDDLNAQPIFQAIVERRHRIVRRCRNSLGNVGKTIFLRFFERFFSTLLLTPRYRLALPTSLAPYVLSVTYLFSFALGQAKGNFILPSLLLRCLRE